MNEMEARLRIAELEAHQQHMRHIYGLRYAGFGCAFVLLGAGAAMVFAGLQGSFDWAFTAPTQISSKITNASPGIVFCLCGMILAIVVARQQPVNFTISSEDDDGARDSHIMAGPDDWEDEPRKIGRRSRATSIIAPTRKWPGES